MATVNATNYAKAADPSSDNILGEGLYGGRVRCQVDDYTLASTVSGTVINIAALPVGAKVLQVRIYNAALGTGVTLGIGYGAAGVEFLGQTSAASAGVIESNLLGAFEVTTAANGIIIVTTAGATGSGKITTQVYYTTD